MKILAKASVILCLSAPITPAAEVACAFTDLCTGLAGCAPPDEDATIRLRPDTTGAEVTMDGETFRMVLAGPADKNPVTYFDDVDDDEGGGMMLSLFDNDSIVMTIHGDLFGPFTATAIGICEVAQ